MRVVDTNVVLDALLASDDTLVRDQCVSSVTAVEFLQSQPSGSNAAKYFLPVGWSYTAAVGIGRMEKRPPRFPHFRNAADTTVMEFNNEYPTVVLHNNQSIALAINERRLPLFQNAVGHLGKERRKRAVQRFRFLIDAGVRCEPVAAETVELASDLLDEFERHQNVKDNFHNSWFDLLIFATAYRANLYPLTHDKELRRFVARKYGAEDRAAGEFVETIWPAREGSGGRVSRESKGYINRGWQVTFRKGGGRPPA